MTQCFSLTTLRNKCFRYSFVRAGMSSMTVDLRDGTTMHCWVPKSPKPTLRNLVCIHGFGANAMWQWEGHLRSLLARYNVYVPDLLFFGESFTTLPERTEIFQAQCLVRLLTQLGISRTSVAGISYGGFVAYRMAELQPELVDRVVLCCTAVCLDEKDLEQGLFMVSDMETAISLLIPQTAEKLRELVKISYYRPPPPLPTCFLNDFIHVMCTEYAQEKRELLLSLGSGMSLSDMPRITQPTLIMWGEHDRVFRWELAHRLKRHIGENAELAVMKNVGHALNLENPKEFVKHLTVFLADPLADDKKGGGEPSMNKDK